MDGFCLHFMYLVLQNVMSMFFLGLDQLVHMHVSHDLGWLACACSAHNNFSLYKIEYSL